MSGNVYEPDTLNRLYRTGGTTPADDGRCRLHWPRFESRWNGLLAPEDRDVAENRGFNYLMVEPVDLPAGGADEVLVIFHGLNEGSYARMLPWAASFALRLGIPVILFPLSFHVGRRSNLWRMQAQSRIATHRANQAANGKASPFNGRISERLSQAPERYVLGGLQSYFDAADLAERIESGGHEGCRAGASVRFLGYSAGGYLALILLLGDPGGRFTHSRAALFSSCAPLDGIRPGSLFIMDDVAADRLSGYLQGRTFRHDTDEQEPSFPRETEVGRYRQLAETPTRWLAEVLFHGEGLVDRMEAMGDRMLVVVNPADRVISAERAAWNLRPAPVLRLDLGVHEFPFTTGDPLPLVYDRRAPATRTMIRNLRNAHHISPAYRPAFDRFIHDVSTFLFPGRPNPA